jgi:hypothetical protein
LKQKKTFFDRNKKTSHKAPAQHRAAQKAKKPRSTSSAARAACPETSTIKAY